MEADLPQMVKMDDDRLITTRETRHEIPISTRLLGAAVAGDWKVGEEILEKNPVLATARLTPSGETALHVAAAAAEAKHEYFVNKFLEKLPNHDLTITNQAGSTALHLAALAGNEKIAELMVRKNAILPTISNNQHVRPIFLAAMSGNGEMVEYLLQYSNFGSLDDVERSKILNTCIDAELYGIRYVNEEWRCICDHAHVLTTSYVYGVILTLPVANIDAKTNSSLGVAQKIVREYSILALTKDRNGETPLDVLARKPSAFSSKSQRGCWWRTVYANMLGSQILSHKKEARDHDAFELLEQIWQHVPLVDVENPNIPEDIARPAFVAAELGNYEFLVKLLGERPEFLYIVNGSYKSIYHIAVIHRHELIFSLIYEIGKLKDLVVTYRDYEDNNILHLAAKLAPQSQLNILPGAALQMHRELLWYKEVEKIVPPTYRGMRNKNGQTPHELFINEHSNLMKEGEKWLKETSHSCMIVATLIATMVFTTAFTVPGGNNDDGGPILLHERLFTVLTISETIAMLSSTTSIIMFLCIRTSRYTEKAFLEPLPFCLMTGIMTLFVSLAGMMVAFCACLLSYHRQAAAGSARVPTLLGVFACVPAMFVFFKCHLLTDITTSLYAPRRLFRSRKRLITK